jgi:magnesium chelatase subunit D
MRDILLESMRESVSAVYVIADKSHVCIEPDKFISNIFGEKVALDRARLLKKKKEIESEEDAAVRKIMATLTRGARKITRGYLKSGRRMKVTTRGLRGRYVRFRMPEGKAKDIALGPTIRSAILHAENGKIQVRKDDFRDKIRRRKVATMICLVFDTSGSMNDDIKARTARAVTRALLLDAYQRRDKVCLITYCGSDAQVIVPLTSSVELAKRKMEKIPFGGTTPMAAGLQLGLSVLRLAHLADPEMTAIMVVVTDGTANTPISIGANVYKELVSICHMIKEAELKSLIIDVSDEGAELARELATRMGGQYYHAGKITKHKVYAAIRDMHEQVVRHGSPLAGS